jgi:hypothetical protein
MNWTTSSGVLLLIVALGLLAGAAQLQFDGDPSTVADWNAAWEALVVALAGLGLIKARENKVSDEQAGAKPGGIVKER